MTINLYNFSKRENSTKQPSGSGTAVTCTLKENCSLFNPVFQLAASYATAEKNYVKWGTRYYFVKDIVYETNSLASLYCEEDVLASWKNAIGTSTQYVVRSASDCDPLITDSLYPAKNQIQIHNQQASHNRLTQTDGFIVFGLSCPVMIGTNRVGIQRGGITYISMTQEDAKLFMTWIQNIVNAPAIGIYRENPFDYIVSCMYIPVNPSTISHAVTPTRTVDIKLVDNAAWKYSAVIQDFDTDDSGLICVSDDSITFQPHPQKTTDTVYLNYAPYSERTLMAGPFGEIAINMLEFGDVLMHYQIVIDLVTGTGSLVLSDIGVANPDTNPEGNVLTTAQIGVPISLSQIKTADWSRVMRDVVMPMFSSAGNAASGNMMGAISGVATGIENSLDVFKRQIHTKGNNGSVIDMYRFFIHSVFHYIVETDNDDRGRPLCKKKTINTLSGYILVSDADVSFAGNAQELATAKQFLESGFFYE